MCRQRGSRGRLQQAQGGLQNTGPDLGLDSGTVDSPVVHTDSTGTGGSDSVGRRVEEEQRRRRRRRTGEWREGGIWPTSGSL